MSARQNRLVGPLDRPLDGPQARGPSLTALGPLRAAAAWVTRADPWLSLACALALLTAPGPLTWPAAVLGLLVLLSRAALTGRPWHPTALDLPLLLLALGTLAGGFASLSREGAVVRLAGLLAGLLLFAAAREHLAADRAAEDHAAGERRHRAVVVGLLTLAVLAGAALLVLVGPFLLLDHVPGLPGLVASVDRWGLGAWVVDQDWLLQRYRLRASGVGALADVGLALACATLVGAGLRDRALALLALLTVPFFVLVLVAADNRGSMVAGALTLGAMATVWRRRLLPLVPLTALLALLGLAFGPVDRGLSLTTLAQRFWFWENSLYLAREVPLTGAGLGLESVQLVYRGYFLPAYPPFSHAHNIYLQGLLESGVLGLAGLVGLAVATLWTGWRAPAAPGRWQTAARLAGFGIGMAMLTTGLTEIVMLSTVGGAIALGGLGLLAATVPSPARTSAAAPAPRVARVWAGPRSRRALVAGGAALVLVAGLAVSGLGARAGGRLLLNLGAVELNRGAFSETIEREERAAALDRSVWLLRLASGLDENDPAIQRSLALALAANDDARRGRAAANRAKELTSPSDRADLFQLGRAYAEISAWGEAIRAWQAAEAAPQLLQLGNRLIRARNWDQAVNAFVATARVTPDSRGAYEGISRVAREREMTPDETVEELAPLLAAGAPTEYGARVHVARVYREAGRLREAADALALAEQIQHGPDLAFERGRLLMRIGRPDAAESYFAFAVQHLWYDPEAWLWLARAQRQTGQYEQAVATVRTALSKLDPSGQFAPPAPQQPQTAAVRAVEIRRSERAPLLGVLAECLTLLGRPAEAVAPLDEAVAAAPDDPALEALRTAVWAVQAGAAANLLVNPDFSEADGWQLTSPDFQHRPTIDTLADADLPTIANGEARVVWNRSAPRVLAQEVAGLVPGARYRLTARIRGEGLVPGTGVQVTFHNVDRPGEPLLLMTTTSPNFVWIDLETDFRHPNPDIQSRPTTTGLVVIGFTEGAAPGSTLWCDSISLTRVNTPR